ncbi:MAG: RagB/SusD family nutrient uptake outer membrane protein [Parabacteroides gordonii]|nr:RagB/SusD family nutrient uptake outer membrane protein [Parabacteroides gordonii]
MPTDDNLNGKGGGPSSGDGFVQLFNDRPDDNRKSVIIDTYGLANFVDASQPDGSLYYVNKYYNTTDPVGKSIWNYPLIRYAEILLAKAEALNEKGHVAGGEAFSLVNQIRKQAGLADLKGSDVTSQQSFREYIMKERRIELAFECKRYFDLNRLGVMQSVMQPQLDYLGLKFPQNKMITHPMTNKPYYLYPVPSTEFVNNAKLGEQNPGYK